MRSAEEIRRLGRDSVRSILEDNIIDHAKMGYSGYVCSSTTCPEWLQEELRQKGFKVTVEDNKEKFGINIQW